MKKTNLLILSIIAAMLLVFQGASAQPAGEKPMKIRISSNDLQIEAVLNNTPASQDLFNRMPFKLTFHSHQNREYYTNISLSKNSPLQDGYKIGDISYWAPGNTLVLFYDQGYTGSLIKLGQITSGLEKLSQIGPSFTAMVEMVDE